MNAYFLHSQVKTAAANGQFGASGGADSSDTEQVTASFALVRSLPIPPPAPSCHHVVRQRETLYRYFRGTLTRCALTVLQNYQRTFGFAHFDNLVGFNKFLLKL